MKPDGRNDPRIGLASRIMEGYAVAQELAANGWHDGVVPHVAIYEICTWLKSTSGAFSPPWIRR